jgi:alpha-mannosidase
MCSRPVRWRVLAGLVCALSLLARTTVGQPFLSIDSPNVVVSDVKQAEDGNDLIIRCYETAGRATRASLDLGLVHRHWTGEFQPLEIKTLRVPLTTAGRIREVNALEQ